MEEEKKAQIFDTGTFESLDSEGEILHSADTDETGIGNERTADGSGNIIGGISLGSDLSAVKQVFFTEGAEEELARKSGAPLSAKGKKTQRRSAPKASSLQVDTVSPGKPKEEKKTVRIDKIKFNENGFFSENKYFVLIAKRYAALKFVSMILLTAFAVLFFALFSSSINVDSFKYLLKDMDFSSLSTEDFETVPYNGGIGSRFGVYRGDLVVANSGLTTLYKSSGAFSFTSENDYYSPVLVTGDKYFLVYDVGNTSYGYSLYNSFSCLVSEHLNYPITYAALCDEGSYAIVSSDSNYKSIVYVYNSDLKKVMEIKKERYVTNVDLSADGKTITVASTVDNEGEFLSEISVIDVARAEEIQSISVPSVIPMQVRQLDNGNIAVMYTDRVSVYDTDGIRVSDIYPTNQSLVNAFLSSDLIAMINNVNVIGNEKDVRLFDNYGRLAHSLQISGEYVCSAEHGGFFYILMRDKTVRMDTATGKIAFAPVESDAMDIVFSSGGRAFVCYSGSAEVLVFEEQE